MRFKIPPNHHQGKGAGANRRRQDEEPQQSAGPAGADEYEWQHIHILPWAAQAALAAHWASYLALLREIQTGTAGGRSQ